MTFQQALLRIRPARRCSGKALFTTQSQAAGRAGSGTTDGFRVRPYFCRLCVGWHLTKKLQWKGGKPTRPEGRA